MTGHFFKLTTHNSGYIPIFDGGHRSFDSGGKRERLGQIQLVARPLTPPADGTVTVVLQVEVKRRCEGHAVVPSQDRFPESGIRIDLEGIATGDRIRLDHFVYKL